MRPARVAVVVAHPDDETLGCGGTIARLRRADVPVSVYICGDGVGAREGGEAHTRWRCAEAAAAILGVTLATPGGVCPYLFPDNAADTVPLLLLARTFTRWFLEHQITIVYTHSGADLNVDHRRVHAAVRMATRPTPGQRVREVYAFEVPSSTEWGLHAFQPTAFVNISQTLPQKMAALAAYGDESPPFPHPRSAEAVCALAMWRASQCGAPRAAEAFEVVRIIR